MQVVTLGLERARIDDAVGAVPVHLGAGIWGTLAVGLLGDVDSFPVASSRLEQIGVQLVGHRGVLRVGVRCRVSSSSRSSTAAFRSASTRRASSPGSTSPSTGPARRSPICSSDMDEQRRSGDFARPVRVEPHTEVGQIAGGVQPRPRGDRPPHRLASAPAAHRRAANESSSVEDALAAALDEVCRFTGWPIGHAFLVSRDDPDLLVSTGVWHLSDEERFAAFRSATESDGHPCGQRPSRRRPRRAAAGLRLERRSRAVDPADSVTLTVVSLEPAASRATAVLTSCRSKACAAVRAAEWLELGLRAGLAVPIMAGSDAVGVLEFFSDEPVPGRPGAPRAAAQRRNAARARRRASAIRGGAPSGADRQHAGARLPARSRADASSSSTASTRSSGGSATTRSEGRRSPRPTTMSEVDVTPGLNAQIDREVLAAGEPRRRESHVVRRGKEHVLADVRFPVRRQLRARSSRSPASTSTSPRRSGTRPSSPSCCGASRWRATRRWRRRPRRAASSRT